MTPCTRSELILVLRLPASNEIIETVDEWAARTPTPVFGEKLSRFLRRVATPGMTNSKPVG